MEPKPPVAPETITLNVATYNEMRDKLESYTITIKEKESQLKMIERMVERFNAQGKGHIEFDFRNKQIVITD